MCSWGMATVYDDRLSPVWHTAAYFLSHTYKHAKIERDRLFFLSQDEPSMLEDVTRPSRQSDTRCQRNTCRANEHLCSSGRPLIPPKACHKTSQWARRMQKPHDTCFCVSYHFSIICIWFISQTQSCEPVWQACSLSYREYRERHRLMKLCDLCFSDRDGLQHAMLCIGLIVYEDRKREMNTSWAGVDVHCCFHFVSYWLSFISSAEDTYIRLFCALFLVIPVMQFFLSSTNICRCAVMCCHLKNIFSERLYQTIIIYVHVIKKFDRLSNSPKIKNKESTLSLKHVLEKKETLGIF